MRDPERAVPREPRCVITIKALDGRAVPTDRCVAQFSLLLTERAMQARAAAVHLERPTMGTWIKDAAVAVAVAAAIGAISLFFNWLSVIPSP